MRGDSIFYKLFKQFPCLLFELVEPPPGATNYQESVEIKETSFRIDGVFLPPLVQNQSDRYKKRTITKMV
jgi:predicted transposase YdaD